MKNFTLQVIAILLLLTTGATATYAQSRQVTGVVKDANGALPGVSVVIKGTTIGTATDAKGKFKIDASPAQTLIFTYLGYETAEIPVGTTTDMSVTMKEESTKIEDLVVIGYGAVARKDVTGAISQVKAEDLLATPASNITEMLRGRVAGMSVQASSGRPGAASKIFIRGKRSFGDSDTASEPLYVIDGVPSTASEFNVINPADVASVDIFKDAAAQAIYGTRAATGVVVVTTKRGEAGKATVRFDAQFGLQSLQKNFDFYSPEEWYTLRAHAKANDFSNPIRNYDDLTTIEVLSDAVMEKNWANKKFTNWEKEMFETAITQKYDLSVSGGGDKFKTFIGLGYLNQDGMLRYNSGYQRGNVRINTDYQAFKWLKVGVNATYMKSLDKREDGNFNGFITRSPLGSIYDEQGEMMKYINSSDDQNPIYNITHANREIVVDEVRLNGFIEIKPFKDLTYKFNASWYNRFSEDGVYKDSNYPSGKTGSINNAKRQDYLIDNIFTYNAPIRSNDHKLTAMFVQSFEKRVSKGLSLEGKDFTVDRDWNMIGDAVISAYERTYSAPVLISFIGRINYGFKERYLLTLSLRHDGSSKFGVNNKWATFPSASLAWRINEEAFLKNVTAIDNLKLRLSYGAVGNQNPIPNYKSLGLATSYPYEFGDELEMGYLPSGELPNPKLKWETSITANVGIDFGLFRNRLTGTLELYDTRVKDMLVRRKINSALGYTSTTDNLGELKMRGVELSLSGDIIRKKDFNWNASVNMSKSKQEIVKVNNNRDENGRYANDVDNKWFIGSPEKVYYDYLFDGIFQESDFDMIGNKYFPKPTRDTDNDGIADALLEYPHDVKPGMIKVKDINGDGKINSEDRTQINREPDFIISFNTKIDYKGFDLYADIFATTGGYVKNDYLFDSNSGGSLQGKLNGVKVHYWSKENPSNLFPKPSNSALTTYNGVQAMQKKDYIRLRTVTLGYTFAQDLTRKLMIRNLRLYVTATNLWTSTEHLSYSPELGTGDYPEPQVWMFGASFTF